MATMEKDYDSSGSAKKDDGFVNESEVQHGQVEENADHLQRRLGNRQIQLLAIGGSIGTALFVSIGQGLARGGPGSLFLAFTLYSCMLACVNNCMAEMSTLHPVSGGFVRMAGKWVDDAFGFMAGWNFFIYEALLIPFEITAINLVLSYWSPNIPAGAIIAACIVLYGLINCLAVRAYGEAEFWLSGGKVILIFLLFFFTFVSMVGGNPRGDAYGFRYWRDPGAFAEYHSTGDLGRFEGFLAALFNAAFTVVGPEYIAMAAAEAKRPRVYIKNAFKTVYFRFALFFILGALCVSIVVPYNEPTLVAIYIDGSGGGGGTAAASPYVMAMTNLGIGVLPHVVNGLMLTSIFSAGNTYTYCATRTLYSLALEGRAPRIFTKCTKNGVPIWSFALTMCFPFLAFLQLGGGSAQVLDWLISLITAGGVIDYFVMSVTYVCFYNACKAQGVDRKTFPYTGWMQPFCGYLGIVYTTLVCIFYGYSIFWTPTSENFKVENLFFNYTMQVLMPILYIAWKVIHKTKIIKPEERDLSWERPFIDAYEASITTPPNGFWQEMLMLIGIGRKKNMDKER